MAKVRIRAVEPAGSFSRPFRDLCIRTHTPKVETLGYSRASLRDGVEGAGKLSNRPVPGVNWTGIRRHMNLEIVIRSETEGDVSAISKVTVAAFRDLRISGHTEQFVIEALRAANVLSVSLVAEMKGRVLGYVAFSPVTISDGTPGWYGLGPVSVLPAYQRQGIGKALIREGLSRLRDMNAQGCCLVGHPDYYRQFGFKNISSLVLEDVPPEVFFALSFVGRYPVGFVTFHEAFKAQKARD